jgi:hypothetical protein
MNERSYVNVLPSMRVVMLPFNASKKAATQYGKALAKADPRNYSGNRTLMVKTVKGMGLI